VKSLQIKISPPGKKNPTPQHETASRKREVGVGWITAENIWAGKEMKKLLKRSKLGTKTKQG